MEFKAYRLPDCRAVWLLNVLDDFKRDGVGIEVDLFLAIEWVTRSRNKIIVRRGKPTGASGGLVFWGKLQHFAILLASAARQVS